MEMVKYYTATNPLVNMFLGHTSMRPLEMLWKNKVHIKSKIMK